MRIYSIFTEIKDKLYAVAYAKDKSILTDLQDKWSDILWLFDFFEHHKNDLQFGIWGSISVDKAVQITKDDAHLLFTNLREFDGANIDNIFKPLHKDEDDIGYVDFQFLKAKGSFQKNSWLRLYALRYDGKFIITGGAIKLTAAMQDREHTNAELTKLQALKDRLKLSDSENLFVYLD